MRSLSDSEILDLIDAGRSLAGEDRAIVLLRLITGAAEETLARLPPAERDAQLIAARAQTIGPRLEACVTCGSCGTRLEATVECDALAVDPPDAFDLTCEECGARSALPFDISTFFWRELSLRAEQILLDVHQLAHAYGWRESDVLSLSPSRRRRYLELLGEPAPFEPVRDEDAAGERTPVASIEPRVSHHDEPSDAPMAARQVVSEADARPQPSIHAHDEKVSIPLTRQRARGHEVVPSIVSDARGGIAVRAARVSAAATSHREGATATPATPHVTVNIARIDVVATPAQASTISGRQKRRESGVSLSTYLAERQTETR